MVSRNPRLSAEDVLNLTVESPGTPINVAAVVILDGGALLDGDGRLRTDEIRAEVAARLPAVPRLRQTPQRSGPFTVRPRWADAPRFRIEDHVRVADLEAPGGEGELLRLTAGLITRPFDRSRPMWQMWLVPGLPGRRIGLVFVLHHVVADGMATIQMITSLIGTAPPDSPLPGPARAPARVRRRRGMPEGMRMLARAWRAPRTSLNVPVGPRRRVAVLHFDLAAMKTIAHRHGGTVNDVVLTLAAGGVRALLHSRAELSDTVRITTSVAVSLRTPGTSAPAGNRTGGFLVRLPVAEADPAVRLRRLATATGSAKHGQSVTAGNAILVGLARLGLARWLSRHQHLTQVVESNMAGPAAPVTMLGVPVLDVVAVGNLAGNVALSVVAFSYAGRLNLTVHADADAFPDLPVLLAGIRHDWAVLTGPISG